MKRLIATFTIKRLARKDDRNYRTGASVLQTLTWRSSLMAQYPPAGEAFGGRAEASSQQR